MIATAPAPVIPYCRSETLQSAYVTFRRDYPAFESTRKLDELRAVEFARLDKTGHVYLD